MQGVIKEAATEPQKGKEGQEKPAERRGSHEPPTRKSSDRGDIR